MFTNKTWLQVNCPIISPQLQDGFNDEKKRLATYTVDSSSNPEAAYKPVVLVRRQNNSRHINSSIAGRSQEVNLVR